MSWVNEIVSFRNNKALESARVNESMYRSNNLLTETVVRTLDELGAGLWGTNKLWRKKYLVLKNKSSWALLQIESVKMLSKKYRILNRIEVLAEGLNRFKIEHTYSRTRSVSTPALCNDLSAESLQHGLVEVCSKI